MKVTSNVAVRTPVRLELEGLVDTVVDTGSSEEKDELPDTGFESSSVRSGW